MRVGKLGSSWNTLRQGGGGVRGGFRRCRRLGCGVAGGVTVMLCGVLGLPPAAGSTKGSSSVSADGQGPWLGAGGSQGGAVDTDTERGGCWLPLAGAHGDQAMSGCEEELSRRSGRAMGTSSFSSPPVQRSSVSEGPARRALRARSPAAALGSQAFLGRALAASVTWQ